ncbi:MAG: RNA 2',3'-cyclic phosphodiesterase [Gammaproteobacteria bacterium]|nr:RNA 2',3'-cyclic phosphodiesterase [Gammaproteobacteria bacterium]
MQRVFIGIPVDIQAQQEINGLLRPLQESRGDIRWVPEFNRHLTLAFLGDVAVAEVDILIGLFDETYRQEKHFPYKLSMLTRFPGPAGRIIALTGEPDKSLDNLFQITLRVLQSGKQSIDPREFRSHVTLGRLKRAKQVKTTFDRQTNIHLEVASIVLYQSTLTEAGPIYTVLKKTELIR